MFDKLFPPTPTIEERIASFESEYQRVFNYLVKTHHTIPSSEDVLAYLYAEEHFNE